MRNYKKKLIIEYIACNLISYHNFFVYLHVITILHININKGYQLDTEI